MSKLIAELLGTDRRTLDTIIGRLDHMTMQSGVDTRLTAEIITQSREKARRLGLDPADTTPRELFHALQAKAEADDKLLRAKLEITQKTSPDKAAEKIAEACEKLLKQDTVIALQAATVKKILKKVPPKKTMRALKFRSIDSVLKREDPLQLYALARRLEEPTWQRQVDARLKRLETRDVSESSPKVIAYPHDWVKKLDKVTYDRVVEHVPEIGAVVLLPSIPVETKGAILLSVGLLLQSGQRLVVDSLPFRTKALSSGLENLVADIAAGQIDELGSVHGIRPSWQAVYQLIATQSRHLLPDFDFVLGDILWQSTETRLASFNSELDYWVNTHYLGVLSSEKPVSLHVIDVAASVVMNQDFGGHATQHLQSSLWNEFQLRYLRHETLESAVVRQLEFAGG